MRLPPFQALLDTHGPDVHRFLLATVGAGDADDCYQETWLAAMRAYPRLRDASNLRSWVFTVAHRKAIDHIRRQRRRAVPVETLPETADVGQPAAERAIVSLNGQSEVWARVRELPTKQRTALALRYVADASYAEISIAMRISEEAARRNVHEGLKRLRMEYRR